MRGGPAGCRAGRGAAHRGAGPGPVPLTATSLLDWFLDPFRDLAHRFREERHPTGLAFDAAHGTQTATFDWLGNYEPARPEDVDAILDALPVDPPGWTFLDLGSGKGRAVLLAALRPFRAVVGIEHRRALHRRAVANLAAFRERHPDAAPATLVHGDVLRHPLPEGPLVLFLYNPFGPSVLGGVLARVAARQDVVVAYHNPLQADVLDAYGFVEVRRGGDGTRAWRLYVPA